MKKGCTSLFYTLFLVFVTQFSHAQLVGTNCYLQGRYLEIGMNNNASFGTCSGIPPTYHPHMFGSGIPPAGSNLAEVYDWGKDGWATGTPPYMGDYTYPGSPFEGWELQIGGGRVQAFQNCAGTMTASVGGMTMTGNLTSYTNTGGRAIGTWTGTATSGGATLAVRQATRIDTLGSAVVVTTVLRNTSGVTAPNVYYMRSCDPDNAQTWPGGGFPTINRVVHQNEDARHRVLVKSYDQMLTEAKSYYALGTKDCRAKAFIYTSWWLSSTVDLSTVWGGTYGPPGTGAQYTLGACLPVSCTPQDIAIGLVYNIGNIAAGDSAIISYAYIFNGDAVGIDEAFPDPQIVLNGVPRPIVPVPFPNRDTFDVCAYPGMTSLPVDILNAEDKSWSWSKWTWSPGVGLSSTTGAHVTITTTALPPVITYTITGTDSAHGMSSCLNKVFYLTILTCNGAESNSPCVGDTLWLNAPGDSVGATYQWFGPAPSTTIFATTQKAFIFPATAAHNGTFSVIKTKAGVPDTSITIVTIRHKPTVWASSNSPLCLGTGNTLLLTTVVDSPGVTYSWSKVPPSFSSTLANPSIPSFSLTDTGMYRVIVTSVFGCKDTDQTLVTLVPPPPPPTVVAVTPYCQNDAFVPFTITGVVPGGTVLWYPSATGGVPSAVTPTVNTSIAGVNKFYFSQKVGSCEGLRDSITVVVNPLPAPIVGPSELCQYFSITKTNPTPMGVWSSSNPSIASIGASTGVVNGLLGGTVTITYTLPTTCRRTTVVTVHPKPAPPTFGVHRECQYVLGRAATATGTSLTWYGLGVTAGSPVPPIPNTDTTPGVYNYYVTQTSPFGCVSDSAVYPVRIYPEPTPPAVTDTTYCQKFQAPPLTAKGSNLLWYTSATSTPGSATAPIPSTATPGVTTYYVTQTVDQCESPRAGLTVTVLYLPDFKITPDRPWICQFDSMGFKYTGPSLVDPDYTWTLPIGASFAAGSDPKSTNVTIKFDTAWGQHYVYLMASNYKGRCATIDTVNIKVIPAPSTHMYHNPDVCLGDTITLALSDRSANAYKYTWTIDGVPMSASPIIDIITASSNSGGPFVISWHDSGRHILRIQGATVEGCKSQITADTVNVHINPDPTFTYAAPSKLCLEDSIHFWATKKDYNCVYKWEPEHSFVNNGKPDIWGKAEQLRSMISLTVTDPFGCKATYTKQINTEPCCSVQLPNAFTPNGDDRNDHFRPIFQGYHRFHIFRVTNRWGQTVFETTNTNPYWDGTFNGLPQDMGVYFYYLKYDCGGKVMETKGDLTLIR